MNFDTLPSGEPFPFWDDVTEYRRVYHVAQQHPGAADDNAGSAEAPFRTINAAARVLQPGEKVVVHAGVYRECVRPARGGSGADGMIAYEAAPGERVVVKGSEVWQPEFRPSAGYKIPGLLPGVTVWMADLPAIFTDGYHPFLLRNAYQYLPMFGDVANTAFLERVLWRRGSVFVDGLPLQQVNHPAELAARDGVFWVEDSGRIHFRLVGDADPNAHLLEISAREQLFAPLATELGYLRVSGFTFAHAADGLPVPQRAAVSTMRGHHWIIERNEIAWANGCGLDLGAQTWEATVPPECGCHIVRGNAIRQCGICGIAGVYGVQHTLIEGNVIEEIGGLNLERMWECGGLKLHFARQSLIRGNTFRHLHHAGGIWLDCSNVDNRITQNVFTDIAALGGGIYMEMNEERNLLDHNIFWDIRQPDDAKREPWSGCAIRSDCNEALIVAHNFFGHVEGHAVMFSLGQNERQHEGRTGVCFANAAYNNVFYRCPKRVHLGRRAENASDGNLYDVSDDNCAFEIAFPAPSCLQHLAGWQRYFGLDQHSTQADMQAEFDAETGILHWHANGPLPEVQPVAELTDPSVTPGPQAMDG